MVKLKMYVDEHPKQDHFQNTLYVYISLYILPQVASAAFGSLLRGGLGAFAIGYESSFVQQDPTDTKQYYTLFSLPLNFRIKETSIARRLPRPTEPLIIYDIHNNPSSKKIRESLCILDINALILPCPADTSTWRDDLSNKKPGSQPPYMIDPNTGFELGDADDVIAYLFRTYGNNKIPMFLQLGSLLDKLGEIGSSFRNGAGATYKPSRKPDMPLQFWAYEASPFCTLVQETLSELELPYVQVSCARGSARRQELVDRHGHFQVPYIEDPNTGIAMFESADIINYLRSTYGARE